jgi:protein involved in polysaccharide export with SLBB domain
VVLREVQSKRIWVLGHVQAPGVFTIAAPITVLEAISLAGGTLNLASYRQGEGGGSGDDLTDLRRSFVLRAGKPLPIDFQRLLQQGDLSQNIYLQPDDFVYLPAAAARQVYVLGAVTQPRSVPFKEGMTVAAAVASAYGTIKDAYLDHVAVVRGSLSKPELAIVNYRGVIRGQAPDMALQPRDIVYVPFSPYRYLTRYAQLIIDTFVSSVAINAGTRWIGQPIGGAAVFIPVGSATPALPAINPPPIR